MTWNSSVTIEPEPRIQPRTICTHNTYHASYIHPSEDGSTYINNIDGKQWGAGLFVFDPSEKESSFPHGLKEGIFTWDMRIGHCTTQYMGIGIGTSGIKVSSYLGRDFVGYSYQPTGEKWHANVGTPYGSIRPSYSTNDIITVEVDIDNGTLGYYKNNSYLGIAYDNLSSNNKIEDGIFPAITLYRPKDSITCIGFKEGYQEFKFPSMDPLRRDTWKGYFKKGKREGYATILYRNDESERCYYKNGYKNGYSIIYQSGIGSESFANIVKRVCIYKNGSMVREATQSDLLLGYNASVNGIQPYDGSFDLVQWIFDRMMQNDLRLMNFNPLFEEKGEDLSTNVPVSGTGYCTVEVPFVFSCLNKAEGVVLSDNLLTATCNGNNRCMLLGSRCFKNGKHYWEVKVNSSEVGSLFLGVAVKVSGSSLQCWRDYGYINYRAIQRHAIEQLYGTYYGNNDVIGVLLNMDNGTLTFYKEGEEIYVARNIINNLGVACRNIRCKTPLSYENVIIYPAFAFKRKGDSITIKERKWLDESPVTSSMLIHNYMKSIGMLRYISSKREDQLNESILKDVHQLYNDIIRNQCIFIQSKCDMIVPLNTNDEEINRLDPLHQLQYGSQVKYNKDAITIKGMYQNHIWFLYNGKSFGWYLSYDELLALKPEDIQQPEEKRVVDNKQGQKSSTGCYGVCFLMSIIDT